MQWLLKTLKPLLFYCLSKMLYKNDFQEGKFFTRIVFLKKFNNRNVYIISGVLVKSDVAFQLYEQKII